MNLTEFHGFCDKHEIKFIYENEITIITDDNYNFYFDYDAKSIPENIIFRNCSAVYLEGVESLPLSTLFENKGDIHLKKETVEKIPKSYKGFNNFGGLVPENLELKKPYIRCVLSDEFSTFIRENKQNKICEKLTNKNENEDLDFPFSFIDCHENDYISFLPVTKIYKLYNKAEFSDFSEYINLSHLKFFEEGKKNKIKIGRFIKKLFPDTTDKEIEEITHIYRSFRSNDKYEFEIVHGEDIRLYYHSDSYDTTPSSNLDNSCYSWKTKKDKHPSNKRSLYKQLDFFVNNPNIGLLVLREKNATTTIFGKLKKDGTPDKRFGVYRELKKIKARALIWSCINNKKYVDMVYYTKETENFIYKRYAIENGYMYHSYIAENIVEVSVPEDIKKLKVIPGYLDSLNYLEEENIVKNR